MFVPVVIPRPYRDRPVEGTNAFPRLQVIDACERAIADIDKEISDVRENMIATDMKKKRFFFGRHFTREEAIDHLQNNDGQIFSSWSIPELVRGSSRDKVSIILQAAKKSTNDSFYLTHSEVNRLDLN